MVRKKKLDKEMDNEFQKGIAGSSAANVIFIFIFVLVKFLKERCKKSSSSCHTSVFDCSTELEEMKAATDTVRELSHKQVGLLEGIHERLGALENRSRSEEGRI